MALARGRILTFVTILFAGYICASPPRAARALGKCTQALGVFPNVGVHRRRLFPRSDFVMSSYQELKKANPTFPILIRECSGVEAKLIARYGEF